MIYTKIIKGHWLKLPSNRIVQVCKITGTHKPEVSLRYLDDDGVMATGDFVMLMSWLVVHARRVDVAM